MASRLPERGSDRRYVWSWELNAYVYTDDYSLVPPDLVPRSQPVPAVTTTAGPNRSTHTSDRDDNRHVTRGNQQSSISYQSQSQVQQRALPQSATVATSTAAGALPVRLAPHSAQAITSARRDSNAAGGSANFPQARSDQTTAHGQYGAALGSSNARGPDRSVNYTTERSNTAGHTASNISNVNAARPHDIGRVPIRIPEQSVSSNAATPPTSLGSGSRTGASQGFAGPAAIVQTQNVAQHPNQLGAATLEGRSQQAVLGRDASAAAKAVLPPKTGATLTQSLNKVANQPPSKDATSTALTKKIQPPPEQWKKTAVAKDENSRMLMAWYSPAPPQTSQPHDQRQHHSNVRKTRSVADRVFLEDRAFRHNRSLQIGDVFEALVLLPQPGRKSDITARGEFSGKTRPQKFVVSPFVPGTVKDSFIALPISTNNGRGCAAPGLIKRHFVIAYSRLPAPGPLREELPRRINDRLEDPMMPVAILIETMLGFHLDPKARIDLHSIHCFQSTFPIRIIGRVHETSREDLRHQFRLVWGNDAPMIAQWNAVDAGWPTSSVVSSTSDAKVPNTTEAQNPQAQVRVTQAQVQALAIFDSSLAAATEEGRAMNAPPPQQLTPAQRLEIALSATLSERYFTSLKVQRTAYAAFDLRVSRTMEAAASRGLPRLPLPDPQQRIQFVRNEELREQYFSRLQAIFAAVVEFDRDYQKRVDSVRSRGLPLPPELTPQERLELATNSAQRAEFFNIPTPERQRAWLARRRGSQ